MRYLLDSCAIVWWLKDPALLSTPARDAISDPENDVFFSAASVWELGLKITRGRIEMPADFTRHLRDDAFGELEVNVNHAEHSFQLPRHHEDPFDRLLIAQSATEHLTFITRDRRIAQYDIPLIPC